MATDDQQLSGDPSQPIDTRAEDLLSRMNVDEKLAQVGCASLH